MAPSKQESTPFLGHSYEPAETLMSTSPRASDKIHQWRNEPAEWNQSADTIQMTADAGTDFWRKTHDGGIRDNGHFYFAPVTGDFIALVQLTGQFRDQYDQAGLMARVDEATWLKCGIELVDGAQLASVVVTRDWSDWSVRPVAAPPVVWWKLERHEQTIEAAFSLDGKQYDVMRQTYLTSVPGLEVGIMACAPKGAGFSVTFRQFEIRIP